jgi:predicted Zn-dependent peptidase
VIGSADVISSVSRRALRGYHDAAYVAGNVVLAAAGNVEHDRLVELLRRRRDRTGEPLRLKRRPLHRTPAPRTRFLRKDTEQYHVVLSGPGVSRADDRRYTASIVDAIVGGSASSRLFQEIREKRGMAYSVYSYGTQFAETGQVGIYIGTRSDNLLECLEVTASELRHVGDGGIRPGELERAKENLRGRLLLSLESTSNRMTRLGRAVISDIELLSLEETIERIDAVTADDVAALARELLAPEVLSVAGIGPREKRFRDAVARFNPHALAA